MDELNEEAYFHLDNIGYKNYIPIPYELLTAKEFREISSDAILLYMPTCEAAESPEA